MRELYFSIAEFDVRIVSGDNFNVLDLLPSLKPFLKDDVVEEGKLLFSLSVDNTMVYDKTYTKLGDFDSGNGHVRVSKNDNDGYQFVIRDISEEPVCMLKTDKYFQNCKVRMRGNTGQRAFGLNSAMMLVFAFASVHYKTILIHASSVEKNGKGYAFTAKSGTGKSTQVSNWLRYIPNCQLLNDDNPIIRIIGDEMFIYGSPWSGKTPCYRNRKAKLGAIVYIKRDTTNYVENLNTLSAFSVILPSCSTMKWDSLIYNTLIENISEVISKSRVATLHCLPDRDSAEVCHKALVIDTDA